MGPMQCGNFKPTHQQRFFFTVYIAFNGDTILLLWPVVVVEVSHECARSHRCCRLPFIRPVRQCWSSSSNTFSSSLLYFTLPLGHPRLSPTTMAMATAAARIVTTSKSGWSLFFWIKLLLLLSIAASAAEARYQAPLIPSPAGTISRSFYLNNHPRHKMWSASSLARYEGSSDLVQLRYHMGPVLSSPLSLYLLWYGRGWDPTHQSTIRDFLLSVSDPSVPPPSVQQWWSTTAALYTDQTGGNITRQIVVAAEASLDPARSQGRSLTRLTVQNVLADAIRQRLLPVDQKSGAYLLLTSPDITVQDFCRAACGFHYFTFPSIVGHTLPYAWVGNSAAQCPETCAYPFAVPGYMAGAASAMLPPNGDVGVDGMVSVVGHELAELSSNPLVNAWYAGEDPTAPTEIADLCEGVYGTGGGGGYTGEVSTDGEGRKYNLNGRNGRRFLVQWIWSPVLKACSGPNAMD